MQTVFMLLSIYNRPRLALDQVCDALGIAKQTGYNLRSRGTFPVPMAGHPLTADVRDVAAYLDQMRGAAVDANFPNHSTNQGS